VNVYISGDIEGITGLVSWSQCGRPDGEHYDFAFARERYTADVNAAIRGAREAGAEKVVVKDSHGNSKNLLVSDLESGVELISGHGAGIDGMMAGIDSSFDCALLIGYHAMAGTPQAVMEHTIASRIHRMTINGTPAGEIAMSAGVAGRFGVPIVAISSDKAGCAEAAGLIPGIETASVKEGLGRYMARCLHPSDTAHLIESAAREGVRKAASTRPWKLEGPVTFRIEFAKTDEADLASRLVGTSRIDGYSVEYTGASFEEAHRAAWTIFAMGGLGNASEK
jgi:D-amino peptidase